MEALICTLDQRTPRSGGRSIGSSHSHCCTVSLRWRGPPLWPPGAPRGPCGSWATLREEPAPAPLPLSHFLRPKSGERLKSFKGACLSNARGTGWRRRPRGVHVKGHKNGRKKKKEDDTFSLQMPKSANYMQGCKCTVWFQYNPGSENFVSWVLLWCGRTDMYWSVSEALASWTGSAPLAPHTYLTLSKH